MRDLDPGTIVPKHGILVQELLPKLELLIVGTGLKFNILLFCVLVLASRAITFFRMPHGNARNNSDFFVPIYFAVSGRRTNFGSSCHSVTVIPSSLWFCVLFILLLNVRQLSTRACTQHSENMTAQDAQALLWVRKTLRVHMFPSFAFFPRNPWRYSRAGDFLFFFLCAYFSRLL